MLKMVGRRDKPMFLFQNPLLARQIKCLSYERIHIISALRFMLNKLYLAWKKYTLALFNHICLYFDVI